MLLVTNACFIEKKLEGQSVERMYLKQRPKSENCASLTPLGSATVRCTEKLS